jgi:hypothetical protein
MEKVAKAPKKGGDKTPNALFKGITFSTNRGSEVELHSDVDYHETGHDQFDFQEGQLYEELDAEQFIIEQLQGAAANTAGTDHNNVGRIANFLNYVTKQGFTRLWVTRRFSGDEFGTIDQYVLPVQGGYYTWEGRTPATA